MREGSRRWPEPQSSVDAIRRAMKRARAKGSGEEDRRRSVGQCDPIGRLLNNNPVERARLKRSLQSSIGSNYFPKLAPVSGLS